MSTRLAILGPYPNPARSTSIGGVATHSFELARWLRDQGLAVGMLSDSHNSDESSAEVIGIRGDGVAGLARRAAAHPFASIAVASRTVASETRRDLGLPAVQAISKALLFREAATRFAPDVLHIQQADFRPLIPVLAGTRIPTVITVHGLGGLETREYPALADVIPRHLRSATVVTTPSSALAHEVVALGIDEDRIRVIPNGVDTTVFLPGDRGEARAALGLDVSDELILYAGRITRFKGAEDLLEAHRIIRNEDPRIRLAMVGPWAIDRPKPSAGENIIVRDAVPHADLATWYRAASCTIVPSHYEGFGLTALESLACGTPVVATEVGGLPELVDDSVGALAPPEDPAALAEAILVTLHRADADISREAVLRAGAYSWQATASAFEVLYREILA